MKHENGTDTNKKKRYMTYGIIVLGLVVGLVMKNLAVGLCIGLIGASVVDYIDKRNK